MTQPLGSFRKFERPDNVPPMEDVYDAWVNDKEVVPCANHALYDETLWMRADSVEDAKKVCWDCPSRESCLYEALTGSAVADIGVWGGTTWEERLAMRRGVIDPIDVDLARDVPEDHPYRVRCACAKCRVKSAVERVTVWARSNHGQRKRSQEDSTVEDTIASFERRGMEDLPRDKKGRFTR